VRDWLEHLVAVQAVDRAVALGAQAFGALIPLLIVYASVAPGLDGRDFASTIIERLGLHGAPAQSLREAIAPPGGVAASVSVIGVLLVIVSMLALARALQRLYELSYGLYSAGIRGTPWHLVWVAMIPVYFTVRPAVAEIVAGWWHVAGSLLLGAIAWLATPYVLLGRRVSWQRLLPAAIMTSVGMTVLGGAALIYLPHSVTVAAQRYGTLGVAFSLLSWLVLTGFVLVGAVSAGAVALARVESRGHTK
jgi:membrane protein